MGLFSRKKKNALSNDDIENLKRVLKVTDHLLGSLPEEEIEEFSRSEEFKIYHKILNKLLPELEIKEEEIDEVKENHIKEIEELIHNKVQEYLAKETNQQNNVVVAKAPEEQPVTKNIEISKPQVIIQQPQMPQPPSQNVQVTQQNTQSAPISVNNLNKAPNMAEIKKIIQAKLRGAQ